VTKNSFVPRKQVTKRPKRSGAAGSAGLEQSKTGKGRRQGPRGAERPFSHGHRRTRSIREAATPLPRRPRRRKTVQRASSGEGVSWIFLSEEPQWPAGGPSSSCCAAFSRAAQRLQKNCPASVLR